MKQKPTISTVKQLMEFDPAPREETIEWIVESGITELADAWDRCHRADWMLWLSNALDLLSDRECRLIACKCVRETPLADGRVTWDLLTDERSRVALTVAERYASGCAPAEELDAAWDAAWDAALDAALDAEMAAAWAASRAAARDAARDAAWDVARAAAMAAAWDAAAAARTTQADASAVIAARTAASSAAYATQADIVREIVGNPFRDSAAAKGEKQ